MTIKAVTPDVIVEAADLLKSGECVAIPTETVYGLAANALDDDAVKKIFEIKKRPNFNPLIIHFASLDMVKDYVDMPEEALTLATSFWPGPMTLIVKRRPDCKISDVSRSGLDTVAIRIPDHKTACKIIAAAGLPLAAPSANMFKSVSPTTATHVYESLGDRVKLIVADGGTAVGLESTVIDLTEEKATILRPGGLTAEQVSDALGYDVRYEELKDGQTPKSPGQLLKHYAPKTPVRLRAYDVEEGEALLAFGSTKFMPMGKVADGQVLNLSEKGDLYEAASNLFAYLRTLDASGAKSIAVMDIPGEGIGVAINDRLKRAAQE